MALHHCVNININKFKKNIYIGSNAKNNLVYKVLYLSKPGGLGFAMDFFSAKTKKVSSADSNLKAKC